MAEVDAPTALEDLVRRWARRAASAAWRRGRTHWQQVSLRGKRALAHRQARQDLDQFWIRLGKTAYQLQRGGEIDHPGILRAMARIDALTAELASLEPPR
jgi:hypothetical protein